MGAAFGGWSRPPTRAAISVGAGPRSCAAVQAAVATCTEKELLVVADGAAWIRTYYRDTLAALPVPMELLLD